MRFGGIQTQQLKRRCVIMYALTVHLLRVLETLALDLASGTPTPTRRIYPHYED